MFMSISHEEYLSALEEFANKSPEEVKDMTDMYYKSPRGIEEPVWTRWQTVSVSVLCLLYDMSDMCAYR